MAAAAQAEEDRRFLDELKRHTSFVGEKNSLQEVEHDFAFATSGVFYTCILEGEARLFAREYIVNRGGYTILRSTIRQDGGGVCNSTCPDRHFVSVQELIEYLQYRHLEFRLDDGAVHHTYLRRPYLGRLAPCAEVKYHVGQLCLVYPISLGNPTLSAVRGDFVKFVDVCDGDCCVHVLAIKQNIIVPYGMLEMLDIQPYYGGHTPAREQPLAGAAPGLLSVRRGFIDGSYVFDLEVAFGHRVVTVKAIHDEDGGEAQLKVVTQITGATDADLTCRTLDEAVSYVKCCVTRWEERKCVYSFPFGLTILPKDEKASAVRETYLNTTCSIIRNFQDSDLINRLQCEEGDTVFVRRILDESYYVESFSVSSPTSKSGVVPLHCLKQINKEDWYHDDKTEQEASKALDGHEEGTFLVTKTTERDVAPKFCALHVVHCGVVETINIHNEDGTFTLSGLCTTNLQLSCPGRKHRSLHKLIHAGQTDGFQMSDSTILILGRPLLHTFDEGQIQFRDQIQPHQTERKYKIRRMEKEEGTNQKERKDEEKEAEGEKEEEKIDAKEDVQ